MIKLQHIKEAVNQPPFNYMITYSDTSVSVAGVFLDVVALFVALFISSLASFPACMNNSIVSNSVSYTHLTLPTNREV